MTIRKKMEERTVDGFLVEGRRSYAIPSPHDHTLSQATHQTIPHPDSGIPSGFLSLGILHF